MIRRARSAGYPCLLFALNAWICGRLFRTEYFDQLQSIEGMFIGLELRLQHDWSLYRWFSLWWGGLPLPRVYQPGLHYLIAAFSSVSGLSVPRAYNWVIAATYSLGAVACYFLAWELSRNRRTAFCAGLLLSLFSPSLLLSRLARVDAGGIFNARRLQALTQYGEGPNVTGLMLVMLSIALLQRDSRLRSMRSGFLAAIGLALVPSTSWPSTVALALGVFCWFLAQDAAQWPAVLKRLLSISVAGALLAGPFALPSTVWTTFHDANHMMEQPTPGSPRWIAFGSAFVALAIVRFLMKRAGATAGACFPVLFSLLVGSVVLIAEYGHVRMLPLPARFQLALEIGLVITAAFTLDTVLRKLPKARVPLLALLALASLAQAIHYRSYAKTLVRPLEITKTVEYREAKWVDSNVRNGRFVAPGTISFWANAFADTPGLRGCCDQSLANNEDAIAAYVLAAGYRTNEESADLTMLWTRAFAIDAISFGGPNSREFYKDFAFPYRLRGRLTPAWQEGDDFIYRIPSLHPGFARIVPAADLVTHPPSDGTDVAELRRFVIALDDPSLPAAEFAWTNSNSATIHGSLQPGQVFQIAENYDPGWRAFVNGNSVPVQPDGLGMMTIATSCTGPCTVNLHWSPGTEPWLMVSLALSALATGLALCAREWRAGPMPK